MSAELSFVKTAPAGDHSFIHEGESAMVPLVECHGRLEVDDRLSRGRLKTAATEEAIAAAGKIKPVPGRVYILNVALGSFEFWGDNNNGDAFPEAGLLGHAPADVPMSFFDRHASRMKGKDWGHKTFLKGHVFEEHRNTDPKLAIGGIDQTFWNPRMHRCENIMYVNRQKAPRWAERIDANEPVGTSMACRIPFDRCSVCGNLAPTRVSYCKHLKAGGQLRTILPDGRRVCMINDFPAFFDDSLVENPAAPEALTLMKIASDTLHPDLPKLAGKKRAEITKDAPDLPTDVALDAEAEALYQAERPLPDATIEKLAPLGLPSAIEAAERLKIAFRPSELLKMHFGCASVDAEELARLDKVATRVAPCVSGVDLATLKVAGRAQVEGLWDHAKVARAMAALAPFVSERSYDEAHLTGRLVKMARSASPISAAAAPTERERVLLGMYHALHKAASGTYGVAKPNAAAVTRLLGE